MGKNKYQKAAGFGIEKHEILSVLNITSYFAWAKYVLSTKQPSKEDILHHLSFKMGNAYHFTPENVQYFFKYLINLKAFLSSYKTFLCLNGKFALKVVQESDACCYHVKPGQISMYSFGRPFVQKIKKVV